MNLDSLMQVKKVKNLEASIYWGNYSNILQGKLSEIESKMKLIDREIKSNLKKCQPILTQ